MPEENTKRHASTHDERWKQTFFEEHGYEEEWQPVRKMMAKVFFSERFDAALGACIITSIILLTIDTDKEAAGEESPVWLDVLNVSLMTVYLIELLSRLFVFRLMFFFSVPNLADAFIVGADVFFFAMTTLVPENETPSVVILRMFRLCKLGRARRLLRFFPELNVMVLGLVGAGKAILWGTLLLLVVISSWGIVAVQVLHPLNLEVAADGGHVGCERCPRAFASVPAAVLTLTQHIIAGDSWGMVAIPIIEEYPFTFVIFFLIFITVGMAVMNLILAVVIDCANQARKQTDHEIATMKADQYRSARQVLSAILKDLDDDDSHTVTLQELEDGYLNVPQFQDAMKVLDVKYADMSDIFRMMDQNKSGDVDTEEFINFFYAMKTEDTHSDVTLIKYYVTEIQKEMKEELAATKQMLEDLTALQVGQQAIQVEGRKSVQLLKSATRVLEEDHKILEHLEEDHKIFEEEHRELGEEVAPASNCASREDQLSRGLSRGASQGFPEFPDDDDKTCRDSCGSASELSLASLDSLTQLARDNEREGTGTPMVRWL